MHLILTGGTGFIGRAVVRTALERGHCVTALVRDSKNAHALLPTHDTGLKILAYPNLAEVVPATLKRGDDRLIHLAWEGVGKYTDPSNLLSNVEPQFGFLAKMLQAGFFHITIAGSCLEYGLREGLLSEDMSAEPITYYGLGKQTLFRMLMLLGDSNMKLNWLRYFYVYGPGQRPQALLPQLMAAIKRGDKTFNMSPGDQSRDFIHVDTLARSTVLAAEQPEGLGVVNVGSGQPLRVIDVVREVLRQNGSTMDIKAGFYPYASYEPFAFWADVAKLNGIPGATIDQNIIERCRAHGDAAVV